MFAADVKFAKLFPRKNIIAGYRRLKNLSEMVSPTVPRRPTAINIPLSPQPTNTNVSQDSVTTQSISQDITSTQSQVEPGLNLTQSVVEIASQDESWIQSSVENSQVQSTHSTRHRHRSRRLQGLSPITGSSNLSPDPTVTQIMPIDMMDPQNLTDTFLLQNENQIVNVSENLVKLLIL